MLLGQRIEQLSFSFYIFSPGRESKVFFEEKTKLSLKTLLIGQSNGHCSLTNVQQSIQLETLGAVRSRLLKTSLEQDGMGSTNLSTGCLGFEKLFKELFSETPLEEACESGCVYKRIGDLDPTNEYCFVPWQGGVAECMVRTSI